MLKTASLFAMGVGTGVLAIFILRPASNPEQEESTPAAADRLGSTPTSATVSAGADSSDEELIDISELEGLVIELYAELQESRRSVAYYEGYAAAQAARIHTPDATAEQLVAAGFTQDRAEWILDRFDDLLRERAEELASVEGYARSPKGLLRKELGDLEFEKVLTAIGEPAAVRVNVVYENSPAAIAGLMNNDRIVSYDGQRVFDSREVNDLALQGRINEGVIVEVLRDDIPMQLVIPRGPLGAVLDFATVYFEPQYVPNDLVE